MRRLLFFFIALFYLNVGWTQSMTNYAFTSNTASVLDDLSVGATSLMTGNNDDAATVVSPIGFDFYFGGIRYSHFSANSNGQMKLHASSGATVISGTNVSSYTASTPILFPMAGDNELNDGIKYKLVGIAPNRKLVVEWSQFYAHYTDITNAGNMQVWLEEGTGKITYVYGEIYNSSSSTVTRGIALSFGNTATTAGYVTVGATPTFTPSATLTTNTFAAGSGTTTGSPLIANLGTNTPSARIAYVFTPSSAIAAPTNLTFSAVGVSDMTLNWDAASPTTNIIGYAIYNSTDNVSFNYVGTVALGTNTYTASGLAGNTSFYWKVYAISEGALSSSITGTQATLPCPAYSGTMTVGPTGTFPNLTSAISNLGACGYTGNIILELQAAYVSTGETFPLNFTSVLPSSAAKTITIRPETGATGLSITSANTTGTVNLNGASYITFDGRPGGVGVSELTISNTNVGNSYAVKFVNDANNNALNYCKLNSVNNNTSGGTIVFGTTTGVNGNDNNTISYCNIYDGAATPYNAIYASGTTTNSATYNSNNTISNCNIYNYYASGSVSSGIYLTSGNTDWTISNNNFYQTVTRVGNANSNYGIYINNLGINFNISGNNIGGGAASCGGSAWTYSLAGATRFVGIYLNISSLATSSVQNNTIANISLASSSGATTMPGVFGGIYLVAGNANIGTVTGNTIGSATGTGSISVSTTTTGAISMGIGSASTGTVSISNNTIGSINVMGTGVLSASFNGIWNNTGATALVINNNTVGSTTTANSINSSNAGTGTTAAVVQGIVNSGAATAIAITNNTIANLNSAYVPAVANTNVIVRGIFSSTGTNTITGNTVRNLSTAANATGTTSAASVIGISMTSSTAPAIVSQNTIYGLNSIHATAAVCVTGIHYGGPTSGTNLVARNKVHGLNIVSSSATADMRGINFSSGLANVQNNVIRLGYDEAGTALTSGIQITGLFDVGSTANTGMYFNSVYIGGTGVNTVAGNTYAFKSSVTTNARTYQNNIFFNGRSNGTTGGKHFAMMVSGTGVNPAGLTLNYNDYIANGTGAVLGYYGADVIDLSSWKTAVGQDLNSISADPLFVAPTAAIPNLILSTSTPCEGIGFDIASITDDYTGTLRSGLTPVDMGAYAGLYAPAGVDMKPTAITAPLTGSCLTATETVTVKIMNVAGSIIDFSVNPVTVTVTGANAAAAYNSNTIVNTGTLAIGGSLDVNMPATIDMTASGTYSFNATTSVTGDVNTGNDALATVNKTVSLMGGIYTVGATGTYATLTAAVNAYNNATCITGPIEFSLTDAIYYTGETFPIVINANINASATKTLTIKPATGVTATIAGNATSIIKLNGADYVIIDGSNNGTTSKNLTIKDSSTIGSSVILISSLGANLGATNNTIKNTNIQAGAITSGIYGVSIGSTSGVSGADNDNNTIQNNNISKAYVGVYASGSAIANPGLMDNLQIVGNSIGSATATDYISHDGITLANATGSNVAQNTVFNLIIASSTPVGITLGTGVVSTTLTRNNVNNITATGTSGYGGRGIYVNTGNATSNLTISNNLVYAIGGDGYTGFSNSSPVGIYIDGTTGGLNIYNNSVNMNSATLTYSSASLTAAMLFNSATITAVDLRNNVFVNTMTNTVTTTSKNYAIYSSAANTAFTNINNNDYYVSGTQGVLGYLGSDQTTLAALVTSFGQNANSINANPVFVTVPVELTPTSPALNNTGATIATVTVDYTGATRSATPDMGAVEFTPPTCYAPSALTATVNTATSATLGWTAGGTETDWNVEYGVTGFTQGTGTTVVVATTPILALTTLTQNTTYQFYVQANCGVPGTSTWTGPFSFTTPYSCPKPTVPTATNITSNSADLGWTAGGTETAWIVYYKKVADAVYTEILNVTTNPYNISGLDPSTSYIFKVKANCSVSDTSLVSDTKTFTTACGAITTFPFVENFNTVTTPALPNCFSQIDGNTDGTNWMTYTTYGVSGSICAGLYTDYNAGDNNDFLVLPQFTLTGNQQLKLSVRARSASEPNDYKIVLSTTDNLPASFTTELKPLAQVSSVTMTEIAPINLSAYSGNVWIAVQVPAGGLDGYYLYIDDITVENIPTCTKPTALRTTTITSADATIGWTIGATETAWNVEYGPVGFTQGTGTPVNGLVDTTYSIADLTANTSYSFYVQADCGIANGQSAWAGPYTFKTLCNPVSVLPWIEGFETGFTDATTIDGCWSQVSTTGSGVWKANNTATSYNRTPRTGNWNATLVYGNQDWLFYQFSLTAGTSYTFEMYARQDGSTNTDAHVKIAYGTNANVASMTNIIADSTAIIDGNYQLVSGAFTPATSGLYFIGVKGYISGSPWYLSIDDLKLDYSPSCLAPTALNVPSISSTGATLAWTAGATETAWNVEYGVTGFTQGTGTATVATTNSTSITGLSANTSYQFYVQANCGGTNGMSTWSGPFTFYTGYCIPAPSSVDGSGITNVTFSTVNNTITAIDETYGDYTAMVGDVQQSAIVPVDITYATGFTYDTKIWIDWNNDLDFNDAGEEVYTGTSLSTDPTTLNASFTVPATAPLGQHRMRIGGQDTGPVTPCYSGTYGVFEDYTVNVISGTSVCNTPTALAASNVGETTADLGWTSTASNFNVRYRTVGATTWTATTASTTTLSLTSLTANTQYEFEVQAVCSATAGDTSAWATAATFTTIAASACATPTALVATSITQTSATLGWTSTAANFNVRYRVVGAATWTATTAATVTLPLTSLTAGTQYEFQVQAICSATAGDTSNWTSTSNFTTVSICGTPTALAATSITETSATLGWTSSAANFNVRYRTVGAATWTTANAATVSLPLSGLTANTQYEFQVKAVCSATVGDTSAWAAVATFTTLATPTCPAPTALVVSAINTAGANLNWTAGGTETAWNIRYKKVVDATYTNVNNTTTKPYVLTGLQASTAYVWNVQAICSGTLSSAWSVDNTFTTTVGIDNNSLNGMSVYSYNNQINVINNGNILVKEVVIYDMIGQQVGAYAINSTDNILINSNLTIGNYVVKVITENKVGNYKLFIK
jgi:hypothetical protein